MIEKYWQKMILRKNFTEIGIKKKLYYKREMLILRKNFEIWKNYSINIKEKY